MAGSAAALSPRAAAVVAELRALGSEANRQGMARYGINTARALGVSMAASRPLARKYRRDHALAAELWRTGIHEARILAGLIEDPKLVTPAQMDAWAADFDSWDLCDQVSMKLFAATPYAPERIAAWAKDEREFVRRAAFATIAGYTVRARQAKDAEFLPFLALVEEHATDPRNFVRKAVNWALRQIGKHSPGLHRKALALAGKLAASEDKTARWIGKDAVRELSDPARIAAIAARALRS
ncbi:MAG TPA: DNA alkylation repair protein [Bauldia sp.]|nr:DNA alkylation repair protein [Bauldia sp.]